MTAPADGGPGSYVILKLGYGGWYMQAVNVTRSHYGETWRDHLEDFAPGAVGVDLKAITDDRALVHLSVSGPMVRVDLPPGSVDRLGSGVVDWVDSGDFGNARGLDYVSVDVYVTLARRAGALIFDPVAAILEGRPAEAVAV